MPYIHLHGCSDLPRARSQLLTDGLATDAERFLLIDSDMAPSPRDITELAESGMVDRSNAVSGCYLNRPGALAAAVARQVAFDIQGEPRFIAMDGAGLGFASVHRS